MLIRHDLTESESFHATILQAVCEAVGRNDLAESMSLWDKRWIEIAVDRLAIVRPAKELEDFLCLYYGDEIKKRFNVDFSGKYFDEIDEFDEIRTSLDAWRLVATYKAPHVSRVSRDQRTDDAVDYTRIIFPIMRNSEVALVASIFAFLD